MRPFMSHAIPLYAARQVAAKEAEGIEDQFERYDHFYSRTRWLQQFFRFDVRYRCRRLHEVLDELRVNREGVSVLDVGFGYGDLLASFPRTCRITGAEISETAVNAAREDSRFAAFRSASFYQVDDDARALPRGPFDLVISSHSLEHVPDDRHTLEAMYERVRPGGHVAVFVPIEEPDYNLFHRRVYSMQSIAERVEQAGFVLRHVEGSMYVNGHVWKLLTVPSRRRWPGVRWVSDALRASTLSLFSYAALRRADRMLFRLGFGARQALVIAQRA